MQINIDLLPKSKKENKTLIIIFCCLILSAFGSGVFGGYLYLDKLNSLKLIEQRIAEQTELQKELKQAISEKTIGITEYKYAQVYQQLHTFLATLYMDPMLLFVTLTENLPEQASIESFAFEVDEGKIWLQVNFPTKKDIALYQHYLLNISSVQHAQVTSIEAVGENRHFYATIEVIMHTLAGDDHE